MIPDVWKALTLKQHKLGDAKFLNAFQPLPDRFLARESYLSSCAQLVANLYAPLAGCRILVPASGCDVLPALLRRLGSEAVGHEVWNTLAARYCRIKRLPLVTSDDWTSAWTHAVFDLVIVTGYATNPGSSEWADRVTERFCDNVFQHVDAGAELVLFDYRYFEPLSETIRTRSWPLEWETIDGPGCWGWVFFRHGSARPRWRRGHPAG